MANITFSKNLRKLREEKKISQKSAAASLGISQALLSHYEKGIRECGLDFLIRAAKFYGVSADYMLGVAQNCPEDTNNPDIKTKNKISDGLLRKDGIEYNISAALYKNLLINAVSRIFDDMKGPEHKELSAFAGRYISASVYTLCSVLYGGISEKPLGDYDFENAYLNNIINNADFTASYPR